jgi:hypothetical protein
MSNLPSEWAGCLAGAVRGDRLAIANVTAITLGLDSAALGRRELAWNGRVRARDRQTTLLLLLRGCCFVPRSMVLARGRRNQSKERQNEDAQTQ